MVKEVAFAGMFALKLLAVAPGPGAGKLTVNANPVSAKPVTGPPTGNVLVDWPLSPPPPHPTMIDSDAKQVTMRAIFGEFKSPDSLRGYQSLLDGAMDSARADY